MTRSKTWAVLVAVGVAAAAGAFALSAENRNGAATPDAPPAGPAATGEANASDSTGPLASVAVGGPDGGAASTPPPSFPAGPVQRVREMLARRRARHEAEAVDPGWAPASATTLRGDLADAVAGTGGEILGVECRTTSCMATVRWSSYTQAFRTYRHLLIQPYRVPCRRSMSVPPPESDTGGDAYEAQLFLDCNRDDTDAEERG